MIDALIVVGLIGAGALVAALITKKITLAQVEAEVSKLASEGEAAEQVVVAKVKALIASL